MGLLILLTPGKGPAGGTVVASGDVLGMVGGRRAEVDTPFLLGAISNEVECFFDIERTPMAKSYTLPFWILGDFAYSLSTPFDVEGDLFVGIETPFNVLDGSDGTFDEGGLTKPLIGWFDNWTG